MIFELNYSCAYISIDVLLVWFLTGIIIAFTVIAFILNIRLRYKLKSIKVERGKQSMAALYAVFAAIQASAFYLIDTAIGLEGSKVLFMLINFICTSYLFFFNRWFRNSIFFVTYNRIQKD